MLLYFTDDTSSDSLNVNYNYDMAITLSEGGSMTTLMEHSDAQPRECSFMPKKLMSTNNFLIGLVLGCVRYDKNRANF